MDSFAKHFNLYETHHSKMITKVTHFIGVPLIIFSLLIFLGWFHVRVPNFFDLTLAWLAIISVLIYYFFLDLLFAATLTILFVLLNLIASYFSQPVPTMLALKIFLATFIIGLVFLFIGHIFENKGFVFSKNIRQMMLVPMFLTAEIYFCLGYKRELKQRIDELRQTQVDTIN